MGFTTGGPRGVGVITSPFTPKADMGEILAVVADRGGYLGAKSEAERDAISGSSLFVGLMLFNTDSDALEMYDGSGWEIVWHDWKSYTPTTTNVSGGTLTGSYCRVGKLVTAKIRHTLAGAGVTGQPSYTMPVTAASGAVQHIGTGMLQDSSPLTEYSAVVRKSSSTVVAPYAWAANLTYLQFVNVSATAPFTWASGDVIDLLFTYEAA